MKEYYIGLDVGTDSVGWAVTDTDYNLLKFKGNTQWGIRLLDESKTAEERRVFRSSRRRTERNKFRLQCLEMLFDQEISKIDIAFFQRLHESNLLQEDKTIASKFSLFNDSNYTDKEYHKQFPTIYHLRKYLIETKEPVDVRLVFLAVSHIVKNRGHFLFDSEELGNNTNPDFSEVWNCVTTYLNDQFDIQMDCNDIEQVQNTLKSKDLSITKKKEMLSSAFSVTKKNEPQYSILSLLAGAKVKSNLVFQNEEYEDTEASEITFSAGYDDKVSIYQSVFGDDFELIERLKSVYDWAILADVLNNNEYISFAKCNTYDKHKSDLIILKSFVKKFIPNKIKSIFNDNNKEINNYVAYSGHLFKGDVIKKCQQSDFLEFLNKQLPKDCPDSKYETMYNEIKLGTFMPKIVSKDNSVIPMQINKVELITILRNAATYLPFLDDVDESGKSVTQKILDIFSYRIPYYVGPLNNHSNLYWLVRNNEKIYPWNFDQVVDVDKSAEKFIENLTSKCTYLHKKDVLPKNSLLYSKFTLLNELNNLKINGKPITVELKQNIYDNIFLRYNKVTLKRLKDYLESNGIIDIEISGIDGDFKNSLKPYRDFYGYNLTDEEKDEIIKAITILGDDKKLLKRRLFSQFGDKLTAEEISNISKLKYTGWGKLSKEFLTNLNGISCETGEVNCIIEFMWNTNNNLMQLLSGNFTFIGEIEKKNDDETFTTLKNEIERLYVSPKVKRPIYQAMQIVEELVKVNCCEPKKIFIEVARGENEVKKRTVSRKNKLVELYKSLKKDNEALYQSLSNTDENELRRDALYLYYTQLGRCLYTGKTIDVSEIYNKNLYDIDHIFPRSKIKDDSLNNRVLVTKIANEEKSNIYPINEKIRENQKGFWSMLLSKDLISREKYARLSRPLPITDEELDSFINRQIVETRQSTKAIAQLLERRYSSKIVYVKASLASEFRKKYKLDKSRDVNDLHHAKDAYLNIVVGNVYNTCFTENKAVFINGLQVGKYSINKMYDYDIPKAWSIKNNNESLRTVLYTMSKNNIRYTRYSFKQKSGKDCGLFKQNILKKGNGQVPIKGNGPRASIEKYGGYNSATATYFALVKFEDKKAGYIKALVPIDLYQESEYLKNPDAFISKILGNKAEILIPCIKYNTLISANGFRMHISSKSSGGSSFVCKPAIQLVLGGKLETYVKRVKEYMDKCKELPTEKEITPFDKISKEENKELYQSLRDKLNNTIFNVKFSKLGKTLTDKQELFSTLSVFKQCTVLMEILNILHANVRTGDLSSLEEAPKSGKVTIGNKIQKTKDITSFKIIHQSITGLFEQEIELLD